MGLTLVLSGCQTQPAAHPKTPDPPPSSSGLPTPVQVFADWNDLDAALDVGLLRGQSAILTVDRQPRRVTFTLWAITGRPGQITFTRQSDGAGPSAPSEPIEILASIQGPQGPTLAQRLVEATTTRLRQLAGVATAPITPSDLAPEPIHETR